MICICGNDKFKIIDNEDSIQIICSRCGGERIYGKELSIAEIEKYWIDR